VFAIGVCYFWPTMLGFVAEYIPKSGAFGLSIMGGMGMFATSIFQPVIGGWLDQEASKRGLTAETADLATGQATLGHMVIFPLVLIVAFGVLFFVMRNRKPDHANDMVAASQPQL
jgi:MFS family permease